jgi:hypothetical protein
MKEPLHRWREERKEKKKREEIKKYNLTGGPLYRRRLLVIC